MKSLAGMHGAVCTRAAKGMRSGRRAMSARRTESTHGAERERRRKRSQGAHHVSVGFGHGVRWFGDKGFKVQGFGIE